jgi:hypothetical protein
MMFPNASRILKRPRNAQHFLSRVLVTIASHQEQVRSLTHTIRTMQAAKATQGMPTTLNPESIAGYLSVEERMNLATGAFRQQVATVNRYASEIRRLRREAHANLNQIRFAATTIADDPTVDPVVRARFRDLLTHRLPPAQALQAGPGDLAEQLADRPLRDDDTGATTQALALPPAGPQHALTGPSGPAPRVPPVAGYRVPGGPAGALPPPPPAVVGQDHRDLEDLFR